ncbi:hypothetical protein [Echinicola vietnamensis]|nr:hypothetical protein [Echinicola vietnamensis]
MGKFIRSIKALDTQAAQKAFSEFIQSGNHKVDQIIFINNITKFVTIPTE